MAETPKTLGSKMKPNEISLFGPFLNVNQLIYKGTPSLCGSLLLSDTINDISSLLNDKLKSSSLAILFNSPKRAQTWPDDFIVTIINDYLPITI